MNRKKFLKDLKNQWKSDGTIDATLTLEDLLDDAATLKLEGAADAYIELVGKMTSIEAIGIDSETGSLTK